MKCAQRMTEKTEMLYRDLNVTHAYYFTTILPSA
jgi:hypothetical protein